MIARHLLVAGISASLAFASIATAADTPAPGTSATATPSKTDNPVVRRIVVMYLAQLGLQQVTAIQTADFIVRDAKVYAGSFGDVERKQLRTNSTLIAESYLENLDYQADQTTTWPADVTKEKAKARIAELRAELKQPGIEALPVLKKANEVFAWIKGKPTITPDVDHFARVDTLVAYAIAHVPDAAKLTDDIPAAATAQVTTPPTPPATATTTQDTATPPPLPPTTADQPATTTGTTQTTSAPADALTPAPLPSTGTPTAETQVASVPPDADGESEGTVSPTATLAARLATIHLIRAAIGEENPAQLEDTVANELKTIVQSNKPEDSAKVLADLKAAATRYVDQVTDAAKSASKWPSDRPAETYPGMAAIALATVRDEIGSLNDDKSDLTGALRRANQVLAWTTGVTDVPPAMDHFAKHQALTQSALGKAVAFEQPARPQ